MRDYKLYLDDILKAIRKIEKHSNVLGIERLKDDDLIIDGIVRNLEIIGEAVKNIPAQVKNKHPNIEWKKISGLRDILAHEYFGVDLEILRDIIRNKLPELKKNIYSILKKMNS